MALHHDSHFAGVKVDMVMVSLKAEVGESVKHPT